MKFFRIHISQSISVGLLLAGMVFYFLKPVSNQDRHDDFAFWLQMNLKANSSTAVADQVRDLSTKSGELESVVRQASALVKAHADDFELPVDQKSQDESDIFNLLISEWDAYQNSSSGMGKAVIIKQLQPHTVLPADGIGFTGKISTQSLFVATQLSHPLFDFPLSEAFNYLSTPLSGGIAINAP